jgi:hypothetical protein
MSSGESLPILTRNGHNTRFRKKNLLMASGEDLFLVLFAHGEVAVVLARMDAPVCFVGTAALHAHTLPNHERI